MYCERQKNFKLLLNNIKENCYIKIHYVTYLEILCHICECKSHCIKTETRQNQSRNNVSEKDI